jgi:lipopolysaccharide biosynthesis regulator YciM
MKFRTYLGVLLAVLLVVGASFLTTLNSDLLRQPFRATDARTIPLWVALLGVFLLGFLPVATWMFVQSLERDLAARRTRRNDRETESLDSRFRRALDFRADAQWHRAAALLEEVLTERPEDFTTLTAYGEVLRLLGRVDEALEVHRRASVLYPHSVGLIYQLADDYSARGEEQVAAEVRNRIQRDFPEQSLRALRHRRNRAMAQGDWEEASRRQDRIDGLLVGTEGEGVRALGIARGLAYQRAVTLLEKDQPIEAAKALRAVLAEEPRFVPAGIMLGEAEWLRGDEDAALDAWRGGYRDTGSPIYLQRLEDHFIEREEPEQAIKTLRELIAATQNDVLLRFFLGRFYLRVEMLDEALKVLESIAEPMDASPTYHYLVGRLHQRKAHPNRAIGGFIRAFRRLGMARTRFVCHTCNRRTSEWHDRCQACGNWNSVEIDIEAERLSSEALGLAQRPTWGPSETPEDAAPRALPHGAPAP